MDTKIFKVSEGFPRIELFTVWQTFEFKKDRKLELYNYVFENSDLKDYNEEVRENLRNKLRIFCRYLQERWMKNHRNKERFLSSNKNWLEGKILLENSVEESTSKNVGRPEKPFEDLSDSSKRKRVQHLIKSSSIEELSFATQMKLRKEGNRNSAEVLKTLGQSSEKRKSIINTFVQSSEKENLPVSIIPAKALAHIVDNKMTQRIYTSTRLLCKSHKADIWPTYSQILQEKKACYPENITITEKSAEVSLQSLIDHTIVRLATAELETILNTKENCFDVIFKWGCDGASGQSQYKQKSVEVFDDSSLFTVSLVPLEIKSESGIVWKNLSSSSTKYCRPIKLIFSKETAELVKNEVEKVRNQINNLQPTVFKDMAFKSTMILTMVDGKICGTLTNVASQNCYICGATPKNMNNLDLIKQKSTNPEALTYGLSSLHAWIKCFECILHISYRLEVRTWQIKQELKQKVEERKKHIQNQFRTQMGLLVDMPKPGYGTTNDGNTARRFFANSKLVSSITGVDEKLIHRLSIILRTIASGYPINAQLFESYCLETANLYIKLYNWYYMPQSVHKILLHGAEIIRTAILPIGQLSEEAQESRNKDAKYIRQYGSRKSSRLVTLEDMIHMLLVSSDPLISSLRKKTNKRTGPLPEEIRSLLNSFSDEEDSDKENQSIRGSDSEETEDDYKKLV